MGNDPKTHGLDADAAPTDARPLTDEAIAAAAGGGWQDFMGFLKSVGSVPGHDRPSAPKVVEDSAPKLVAPVPTLQTLTQGACPVQLSGSLDRKD